MKKGFIKCKTQCLYLMNLSFKEGQESEVGRKNPIREWMERARSTVQPELDEKSLDTDALIYSAMVTATPDPQDFQRRTGSSSILEWARRNIDDNHRGKMKTYAMRPIRHRKRLKGKSVISDGTK
jgi:hypothetical protein